MIDWIAEGAQGADEQLAVRLRRLPELLHVAGDVAAHPVEVLGEIGHLEGQPLGLDQAAEVPLGDLVRGLGQPLDRLAHPARRQIGEEERQGHQPQFTTPLAGLANHAG